ncbi:MAG: hypothetical protein ACRDYD_03175 [Acidimicrobiales bacterium]
MVKRLRWALLGMVVGALGAEWARLKAKARLNRLAPDRLAARALRQLKQDAGDLAAALREGRGAMAEREAELRARVARPSVEGASTDVRAIGTARRRGRGESAPSRRRPPRRGGRPPGLGAGAR